MAALRAINRDDGITVICNLHALDAARTFCDRILGMAQGRIVFDGPAAALTAVVLREIYETAGQSDEAFAVAESPSLYMPDESRAFVLPAMQ
jgi:phosphonate transport system ATP-binding protein